LLGFPTHTAAAVCLLPLCRTLFAFGIVTLSVAVRARYVSGNGTRKWRLIVPSALVVIGSCLIGLPYFYQAHWGYILTGGLLWVIGTLSFYTLPRVYHPEGFAVPLNPILPCLGTLANIFLIGESLRYCTVPRCTHC
jgi:drug/metabolite transporter (DMT)-like permease